jgi:gamma-glutamylcyclotransferase (GGCT)/AIG2-like uncharacterized protein YtfP
VSGEPVFAYGSNMDRADLEQWFARRERKPPVIHRCERAALPNHRLLFNYHSESRGAGAANVAPRAGEQAHGVVLWVDADTLSGLDRKEGHPHRYRRARVDTVIVSGDTVRAWLYRVTPDFTQPHFVPPSAHYLGVMLRAGRYHGLPEDYLAWLARMAVTAVTDPR